MLLFSGNWEQWVWACQLKTYEAGRNATNCRLRAKSALLLQVLLQIKGSGWSIAECIHSTEMQHLQNVIFLEIVL